MRRGVREPCGHRRSLGGRALSDENVQPPVRVPVPSLPLGLQEPNKRAAARVQPHQNAVLRAVRQGVSVKNALLVPLAVPRAPETRAHAPAL